MANNSKSLVADKLVNTSATQHNNYCSPLACLVEEQEENDDDHLNVNHIISIMTDMSKLPVKNKKTEKLETKNSKQVGHLGHWLHIGCRSRNGHGIFS